MKKLARSAAAGAAAVATITALGGAAASAAPPASSTTGTTGTIDITGTNGTTTAGHPAKAPAISWSACDNPRLRAAKAQCGLLSVPLDHARPAGTKIQIAVSRIKATAAPAKRQGPLLLNPGGPGGSGLTLPLYLAATLPKDVAASYDLVGFDPRGVGASKPALSCDKNLNAGPRPDYVPAAATAAAPLGSNETAWLARSKAYADACAKAAPTLLPHLTTVETVKDMDVLRQALGAAKINYYGFSYGTYLGQVYATMFPDRVRRLVFDGNVDPSNVWYNAQLDQDKAFEGAMHEFFTWVAAHDEVYGLGATAADVLSTYHATQDKLRAKAVGKVGPAEWTDVFLPAGYAQSLWPDIAGAFARWQRGETKPVADLWDDAAEVGDDNGFAMYAGVQCVDAVWPLDYRTWRADGFATAARAPFETWGNVWFNTPCMFWHAPQGVPPVVDGSKAPAALLVNTTLDGATPYSGALEVRRRFPHAALVAEAGSTTHADSLGGNSCVDGAVFSYLRSGALPARKAGAGADLTCTASPLPVPNPADVADAGTLLTRSIADPRSLAGGILSPTARAERFGLVTMWSRTRG